MITTEQIQKWFSIRQDLNTEDLKRLYIGEQSIAKGSTYYVENIRNNLVSEIFRQVNDLREL